MRLFLAALVIALPIGAASAQHVPRYGELDGKKPHELKAEKEAEQAYQRSLGRIPEQKGANDPWGTMRSDAPAKPVAKEPQAKRPKAAGAAN